MKYLGKIDPKFRIENIFLWIQNGWILVFDSEKEKNFVGRKFTKGLQKLKKDQKAEFVQKWFQSVPQTSSLDIFCNSDFM